MDALLPTELSRRLMLIIHSFIFGVNIFVFRVAEVEPDIGEAAEDEYDAVHSGVEEADFATAQEAVDEAIINVYDAENNKDEAWQGLFLYFDGVNEILDAVRDGGSAD